MSFDFPNAPTIGQQLTGPDGAQWQWDGVKWKAAPGALTQTAVVVGDVAPSNPYSGLLWFDSVGSNLYLWYPDPTGPCWTLVTSPPFPPAQAAAGNVGRNLVTNPCFTVAQRGAGAWTASGYTADRWQLTVNTADTASVVLSVLSDAGRNQIGDESAAQALQNTFTGTASGSNYVQQLIEGVRRLAGKTVTISFWAIAGAAGLKLGINLFQTFGSGGSAATIGTAYAPSLTTTWTRYSFTATLPSAAGKTIGTSGDATILRFYCSAGVSSGTEYTNSGNLGAQSGVVALYGVQLEIGSGYGFPTPLAKRDPADELTLCQRFYQVGFFGVAGYGQAGWPIGQTVLFPVTMRAQPTIAFSGTTYTNASGITAAGTTYAHSMEVVATATASGGASFYANFTASADL